MVANENLAPQAGKYARFELERRWLVDELPPGADTGGAIMDRYIAGTRLRLRHIGPPHEQFKLSQKEAPSPPDYACTVITTIYLTRAEYEVFAAVPARELCKRRHHLGRYSIDVFSGLLEGLILAETEFATEEEMREHADPEFALADVSDDVRYTGGWLVEHGLPS